jgi:hypothetical protein
MAEALLALMILGPLVLTYFWKSNAALGFLTVCVSFVLSTSVIGDLKNLLSQLNLSTSASTVSLVILILPLLLTMFLTRRTAGSGFKFGLQLVAAICAGGLLALAVGPVLGSSTNYDVTTSSFWSQLLKIQSIVIGAGAVSSLLLIWFNHTKAGKKK